ncbi:MAG: alpha/beta hydrolase [Burkholderiaceae bacterium]
MQVHSMMAVGSPTMVGAQSRAPLIALPGTLLDRASLSLLCEALGRPCRIELLGVEERFDAEIERLAALAEQPAVWLGHSLGGIAALHLAARHPQCCAALVVIGSNLRPDGALGPQRRAEQVAAWDRGGMRALVIDQLAVAFGVQGDALLLEDLVAQAERIGIDRLRRQLGYAAQRPGLLAETAPLRVPVLALSGSRDTLSPPDCGDEIVVRVRGAEARHQTLREVGHLLPMQAALWCAQQAREFLDRIDV